MKSESEIFCLAKQNELYMIREPHCYELNWKFNPSFIVDQKHLNSLSDKLN